MSKQLTEKILGDLIAIPSVTGDFAANNAGLDYIESFLKPYGLCITRLDHGGYGALVATTRQTKRPKVMLVAHLDVVPGPKQLFSLREQDGKLYGRGTWDMKFAVAGFLATVAQMGKHTADYDFGITIFTDDEGRDLQIEYLIADGYLPEAVVLPDGSQDWQIEKTAKGIMSIHVSLSGKSSHGSRPWEGDSASFKIIQLLHELYSDFQKHGPQTDTLNIGLVHSGSQAWNQVPDSAEATLDMRVLNTDSHTALRRRMDQLAKKYGATVYERLIVPPLVHDLENEYFAAFAACIKEVAGVTSTGFVSFGGSDASRYLALGIPCIVVSPPGGGRHSDKEWVDKQGLLQFPQILVRFLEKMARN